MVRPEDTGSRQESGEAIVEGTIGSAAPWFLTGWAHDVEIELDLRTGQLWADGWSTLQLHQQKLTPGV